MHELGTIKLIVLDYNVMAPARPGLHQIANYCTRMYLFIYSLPLCCLFLTNQNKQEKKVFYFFFKLKRGVSRVTVVNCALLLLLLLPLLHVALVMQKLTFDKADLREQQQKNG